MTVKEYALELCAKLNERWIKQCDEGIKNAKDSSAVEYWEDAKKEKVLKLNNELDKHYRFMTSPTQVPHCFIDKETGYIYEPKWMKGNCSGMEGMEGYEEEPKYNLLNEDSREFVLKICDYKGSYLQFQRMD